MTPKWPSPRRLSQPVAKQRAVTAQGEKARRIAQSKIGLQSARSRGLKRGGSR